MNTFWGCTTDDMEGWADLASGHTATLTALLDDLAAAGPAVAWFGPDAQRFQADLTSCLIAGYEAGRLLGRYLERIRAEAEEQEGASAPDGGSGPSHESDPVPRRWDDTPMGAGSSPTPVSGAPRSPAPLFGPGLQNPFGPMIHPDPIGLFDRLREKTKDWEFRAPWWDPGLHRPIPGSSPPMPPVLQPTGGTAPDISITADGESVRAAGAKQVPGLKQVQMLMGAHEFIGRGIDGAEQGMVDSGYGAYTGVLAPVKTMHAVSGLAFGEDSVPGQILGAADAQIANTMHTSGAAGEALLSGDLKGAAREAEMGMFRHGEAQFDLVTASPLRAAAGFASSTLETGADALEPIAPSAVSESLRSAAGTIDSHVTAFDEATSAQRFLDLRYRYLPLPWDQPA